MSENILEEYLVKLGFKNDEPSFQKLQGVMAQAEAIVTQHATGMAKHILEAQGAIVGAFTAISAAILGVVDRAAMADQSYRLLGQRMLMTTDSARKMDMITKALGASLEEIVWDPELHARAVEMSAHIDQMTDRLGPQFAARMKGVRDVRAEFSQLSIDVKFLGMQFASDLFAKLFPDGNGLDKLKRWVDEFEAKIPELADKLSTSAIPILRNTWDIIKEGGELLKETGVAFTNLIGVLSGDTAIQGTEFSFENLLKAIEHVEHGIKRFLDLIIDAEKMLAHFASGTSLLFGRQFGKAAEEFKAGLNDIGVMELAGKVAKEAKATGKELMGGEPRGQVETPPSTEQPPLQQAQALAGPAAKPKPRHYGPAWAHRMMGSKAADVLFAPAYVTTGVELDFKDLPRLLGTLAAAPVGGVGPMLAYRALMDHLKTTATSPAAPQPAAPAPAPPSAAAPTQRAHVPPTPPAAPTRLDFMEAIREAADRYGVPRPMALAVAQQESGIHQDRESDHGAVGIMQLLPSTAKDLKVDPADAWQNIEGGVRYLANLLTRYGGDQIKAIEAYNFGMGNVDKGRALPPETREYVPSVLRLQQQFAEAEKNNPTAASVFSQPPAAPARDLAPVSQMIQRPVTPPANVSTTSQTVTVSLGGIYITQPGADAHQVQRAVADGVREGLQGQAQFQLAQAVPAW